MALVDEEVSLDHLLGRVSKKLGWLNIQTNNIEATTHKVPEKCKKHKKKNTCKLSQGNIKKGKRTPRKDTSSTSDKENSVKGHDHHDLAAEPSGGGGGDRCTYDQLMPPSPYKEEQTGKPDGLITDHLDCNVDCKSSMTYNICQSPERITETCPGFGEGKVFERAPAGCSPKAEHEGPVEIQQAPWELDSDGSAIVEQQEHSSDLIKASPKSVGNSPEVLESEAHKGDLSSSLDDFDFSEKTKVPPEDDIGHVRVDEPGDEPFSPYVPYSETQEPMRWVLTPPAKEPKIKKHQSSLKEIPVMVVSDSDSCPDDSLSLNHKNSPQKVLKEKVHAVATASNFKDEDFDEPPLKDQNESTTGTIPVLEVSDSSSDSPDTLCVQTLSLSERLSKNLKKHRSLRKPKSKKEQSRRSSSSDDGYERQDDSGWRKDQEPGGTNKSYRPTGRKGPSPRVIQYSSSSDDDFEQFLQAIKTPQHASTSPKQRSPSVNEDQYENSFIDDTPSESKDSDDDVFYYRHVNSDKKIVSDQKKETKKTVTFSNYRLPDFSDSDDAADDNVFATPKWPAVTQKLHNPKGSSSTKKFTPVPSWRGDSSTSSQTDFLVSLSTPKHGFSSSSPYVKDFKKHREALTRKLFVIYNQTVFDNKMPSDFSIKWNNRMRKTAGYCYYTKTRLGGQRSARIELSEKVCDTAERLRDTLIHELCHASCWLINGVNDGHGRFWKYWAAKANQAHPSIPIIKRCHSYEITTKYKYQCVTCKTTIGRHSKSINTEKFCCAYCKGNIVLLPTLDKDGKVAKARTPNKFAMFVKENYGSVKKENTSMKHADIMRVLSQDFSKKSTISI